MKEILDEIISEIKFARKCYLPFHSPHEGYGVLLEEVEELWDCIKKSKSSRANSKMRRECIQIAAMAIRFIEDLA